MMPPSLATVGSPALLFVLKIGRGHDARLGSKSCDEEGRLKFQFQSFASFGKASRYVFFHIHVLSLMEGAISIETMLLLSWSK